MKTAILALCIAAIPHCVLSQAKSTTVMIKSIETYGSFAGMTKVLHILNERGELTSTPLEKHNTNGIPKNMVLIKNALDEHFKKGYRLISSSSVSFGENAVYTIEHTYILEKD